jgi:hypothetical protein
MRGGRGQGRAGRGRGTGVARGGDDDLNLSSENDEGTRSSGSDSSSESEAEIPIPQSCRQRPVQLIRACIEASAANDTNQLDEVDIPRLAVAEQPCPRPGILRRPGNTGDIGQIGETREDVDEANDGENQPTDAGLPPPTVAARPRPCPHMLRRPANTEDVEPVENLATSEDQAATHEDVNEVGGGDVEAVGDDSRPGSKAGLTETDVRHRDKSVGTTVNIPEGGHFQEEAVGDGNNGNEQVQALRRNPRRRK